MTTQENGGGQPEVKTKMPAWAWGVGAVLVALLAYAGTQMMSAQQKSEEVNRLLQAARTAQTQAESLAAEAKKKLSEGTAKLRADMDQLKSKLEKAEADVESYRKRVEDLEGGSPPAQ